MIKNLDSIYSDSAKNMRPSEIREILKFAVKKDTISFGGGLPGPEAFPVDKISEICVEILREEGSRVLQYGETEGLREFRECIGELVKSDGIDATIDNILVTTASQQGLYLSVKIFLNPKDRVIVEMPTYVGGFQAFRSFGVTIDGIPLDENGLMTDLLEDYLRKHKGKNNLKLIYVVPTFQNPSGVCLTEGRRKKLIDIANEYDLLILEDDPYSKLRYEGNHIKPLKAFDDENHVIYLSTFSKILAPGLRLGFVVGDERIIRKLSIAKQSADLHTSTFTQFIAYKFISKGLLPDNVQKVKNLYKSKRDCMWECMKEHFPEDVHWNKPEGGLFFWVTLPQEIDAGEMLKYAIEKNVAYVTGRAFYVNPDEGKNKIRLNFSYCSHEKIERGVEILGNIIKKFENDMSIRV